MTYHVLSNRIILEVTVLTFLNFSGIRNPPLQFRYFVGIGTGFQLITDGFQFRKNTKSPKHTTVKRTILNNKITR